MLTGHTPFSPKKDNHNPKENHHKLEQLIINNKPVYPVELSGQAKDLIVSLL
jgi:hypothetical protein